MWADVKEAVPEAQLHIFYGWKLFKQFYNDNPERMQWMKEMEKKMTQNGIIHHDRVSQPELEKWYKQCGIWAYPTDFYEINCISAIKAQLWGCVPVTMDYAALKETVQYGIKVKGDIYDHEAKKTYKEELIKALKDTKWQEEQRQKMMPWARKKYSWENIAKQWTKEFKQDQLKEAIETLINLKGEAEALMPVQLQEKYGYTLSY
jgi:glycosyltransferase involved in cell wall biosynthesis